MKTFLRGQIERGYRGNLAALVTARNAPKGVEVLLHHIDSVDFDYLTGAGIIENPLERAYIGLNKEGGELIARNGDYVNQGKIDFENLDKLVVIPFFLKRKKAARKVGSV